MYDIGWFMICVILLNMVVNMIVVFGEALRGFIRLIKILRFKLMIR